MLGDSAQCQVTLSEVGRLSPAGGHTTQDSRSSLVWQLLQNLKIFITFYPLMPLSHPVLRQEQRAQILIYKTALHIIIYKNKIYKQPKYLTEHWPHKV